MKERYNVAPWNDGKDAVCKAEDGKYILYTDHLAEIREIVDTYDLLIDRCDKKNSELEDELDGYRNGQQQVQDLLAKQIDNSLKLAAENKRLAALNDMFPQEIARLEDRVSEEYEAERADDRARIKELEAERDADRKREYGYSQQTVDALTAERDKLEAENKRLREALDGITTVAKIICNEFPWGTASLYGWVLIGEEALKEARDE